MQVAKYAPNNNNDNLILKPEISKKELDARKRAEMELISNPVAITQQKVPFGVDPKTILCQFFKVSVTIP